MRKNLIRWVGVASAACLAVGLVTAQDAEKSKGENKMKPEAEIGKAAPDFELKDMDGKAHKLSDSKGKIVVLEWINHECPVVNKYHSSEIIEKTQAEFEGKPVVWMAIDSSHFAEDKADKIKEWNKKHGISYPVLLDAPGKVGRKYGAKTTPHIFVIDAEGVLVYQGAVDTPDHERNYVVEAVTAVLDGSKVPLAETTARGCPVKYK